MIKKMAVVAAAVTGLVLTNAGWAVASSGGDHGHGGNSGIACVVGDDAGFSNNCGNTYVYAPSVLGNLLSLLSPPPLVVAVATMAVATMAVATTAVATAVATADPAPPWHVLPWPPLDR